ncbi:hypothetical protein BKA56DRAFT_118104, partial [Ilyonectria sp. MPI-CAGE-AT-0026]
HECIECNQDFNNAEALEQHLAKAPAHVRHECIECDRVFGSMDALEQHLTNALAHRSHRCNECHRIFNNARDLQQHKNSTPNHTRVYENERYTRPLSPPPAYAELGLAVESDTDDIDDVDDISDLDADIAQFLVGFESIPVEDFWDRAADLVLDIESLPVTDPVPTNVSSNAPDSADVLDSKEASSVPSILEKQLKAEREKNKALEKELSSTQEALKKEKLYRQCGMCYERPTNTVTKCGHIFFAANALQAGRGSTLNLFKLHV